VWYIVESSFYQVKPKTIILVFSAFLLSMQYSGVRVKTGFLRIRFMCPSKVTCLLEDCCFSELGHSHTIEQYNNKKIHRTGITQPHICTCPKPRPGFSTPYVDFFFTVQLFDEMVAHFVNDGCN
jgi:hypothetical protein